SLKHQPLLKLRPSPSTPIALRRLILFEKRDDLRAPEMTRPAKWGAVELRILDIQVGVGREQQTNEFDVTTLHRFVQRRELPGAGATVRQFGSVGEHLGDAVFPAQFPGVADL